jgi:multiple antibiotic resistance protein
MTSMVNSLVARMSTDFLIGFSALFSLINPLGMAFVFAEKTRSLPDGARVALAGKVATYSFVLILAAMLFGAPVLAFFGIGIPALRIAGGLLVAFAGYDMLTAPDERNEENVAQVTATTAETMAFFPLTMPLTVGPGTIAASIALGAQDRSGLVGHLVIWAIALPMAITIYACYRHAASVANAIGPKASRIAARLTAFLLMCIGVQMVLTGVAAWLGPLIRLGAV